VEENERTVIYLDLYAEFKILKTTTDKPVYDANELEILMRVSALTDAILCETVTPTEAKYLIRGYIESLKAPALPAEPPPPPEGTIKF
jgi:hypothetical protein